MISPELLRRYSFFAGLDDNQLKEIAMIAEEASFNKGEIIFKESDEAHSLYILQDGSVDLFFLSEEEFHPTKRKEYQAGEINPGEVFSISALLEPYSLTATARAAQNVNTIKIDAHALRNLMADDKALSCTLIMQSAKALRERLVAARIQLAAAWAE